MAIKKAKKQPVRKVQKGELPPNTLKVTKEAAPLYTIRLLDLILAELRIMNKLLKKAVVD